MDLLVPSDICRAPEPRISVSMDRNEEGLGDWSCVVSSVAWSSFRFRILFGAMIFEKEKKNTSFILQKTVLIDILCNSTSIMEITLHTLLYQGAMVTNSTYKPAPPPPEGFFSSLLERLILPPNG